MIEFAAESHPGNRYQHNEDSLGWVESAGVWLVADGMGGHACGDVASRTAKQSLLRASAAAANVSEKKPLPDLILEAHAAVVAEGVRRSAENMGSTVVMARLNGNTAEVGWCGDSRVYLWRDQELVRITRDHSLLEQLLESGVVNPAEAFGHPQKHVLVQALGISNPPPVPDVLSLELADNDMLLLCSDGLHDELRDDEINELLVANPEPTEAVGALITRTLRGEARDNISVICIRVSELETTEPALSVELLRQRFERLPGRRDEAPADGADGDDEFGGVAPAPRVEVAAKIALPTKAAATLDSASAGSKGNGKKKENDKNGQRGLNEFDRDLLIALAAVAILIALVRWVS